MLVSHRRNEPLDIPGLQSLQKALHTFGEKIKDAGRNFNFLVMKDQSRLFHSTIVYPALLDICLESAL